MAKLPRLEVGDGRLRELAHGASVGIAASEASTEEMPPLSPDGNANGHAASDSPVASHGVVEPRQIDVNAARSSPRDAGPFDVAVGVLRSLPLSDTLAILFVLIHLPSHWLGPVYLLYSGLTFAPTISTRTGLNIHTTEFLDWHATMPSFVVVALVDAFILLVWLFLWPAAQQLILDLAKPVMAATLGGGAAARSGRSSRVSLCFALMIAHNIGENWWWRAAGYGSRWLPWLPPEWRLSTDATAGMESSKTGEGRANRLTTILGIHILMQGVIRYIREWYIRRERSTSAAAAATTTTATTPATPGLTTGDVAAAKSGGISGAAGTTDGSAVVATAETPTQAMESGDPSLLKKRRKQSAYVRLQQPLWAALASTKVFVAKEYELIYAASECAGEDLNHIHDLGNAPFGREPRKIWISYIGSDEVYFDTSLFPSQQSESGGADAGHLQNLDAETSRADDTEPSTPSSVVDRAKPFFVRVNKADWPSTRIASAHQEERGQEDDEKDGLGEHDTDWAVVRGKKWAGDIYGLRPSSKYMIEFVDSLTDEILYATTVTTAHEPTKTATSASEVPANQHRPDSPVTTLKTSIAASKAKLGDWQANYTKMRKEWKTKLDNIRKELKNLENQVKQTGKDDHNIRRGIRERTTRITHLEAQLKDLQKELDVFDPSPDGLGKHKDEIEKLHCEEKSVFGVAKKDFQAHSEEVQSAMDAKTAERDKLQQRCVRLSTRINKVETELADIIDANKRGLNEIERRKKERESWQQQATHHEGHLNRRFNELQADNSMLESKARVMEDQVSAVRAQSQMGGFGGQVYDMMGDAHAQAQAHAQAHAAAQYQYGPAWNLNPATPPHYQSSLWSGTSDQTTMAPVMAPLMAPILGPAPASTASSMWPVGPPGLTGNPLLHSHSYSLSHSHSRARARSSSMLSDSSSFAQSSNPDDEAPPSQSQVSVYRQGSFGLSIGANRESKGPLARTRKPSVSEVSGRSSRSGGSGSGGSLRDPTSPIS